MIINLAMKLGHIRVRGVRHEVRGHSVHADVDVAQIVQDVMERPDRDGDGGVRLPASRIVTGKPLAAEYFDCKTKSSHFLTKGTRRSPRFRGNLPDICYRC